MPYQKSISILLFLTIFAVNAQEITSNYSNKNFTLNSDLFIKSEKELVSSLETNLKKHEFISTLNSIKNYSTSDIMALDNMSSYEYTKNLNSKLNLKKERHPQEKTGRILTYIGVPLAIIGGIMVAGADELSYQCVNGDCTGDARGGFGVVFLGAGVGLSTAGIILWSSGSKK